MQLEDGPVQIPRSFPFAETAAIALTPLALRDEQIAFVFDEIATAAAAVEAELAKAAGTERTKRAPGPRKEIGAHLERVVERAMRPIKLNAKNALKIGHCWLR